MATGVEWWDLWCSWAAAWIQTASKSLVPARSSQSLYHLYLTIKSNVLLIIQGFILFSKHGFSVASAGTAQDRTGQLDELAEWGWGYEPMSQEPSAPNPGTGTRCGCGGHRPQSKGAPRKWLEPLRKSAQLKLKLSLEMAVTCRNIHTQIHFQLCPARAEAASVMAAWDRTHRVSAHHLWIVDHSDQVDDGER